MIVILMTVGLLLPLTINIVGYCLDPKSSGSSIILLGGVLILGSLMTIVLLNKKSNKNT